MILSFDIGGANTKAAVIENQKIICSSSYYFPFWKYKDGFENFLLKILKENIAINEVGAAGVTMTAELSDAFHNKKEGVSFILNCVENVFKKIKNNIPIYVLSNDAKLITIDAAKKNPYSAASANWAATASYAAKKYKNGILVDIGSTTTDIIRVNDGKITNTGRTDIERLRSGELIYTGILRTNIAAIVNSVRIRNKKIPVSSEFFAATGDVYLILNKISEKGYTCETADGRDKNRNGCMARLVRVVCADTNELSGKEIVEMAEYIKEKQLVQIIKGIKKVKKNNKIENLIAAGIGSFLVKEIGEQLRIPIIKLNINPAGALGLMVEEKLNK